MGYERLEDLQPPPDAARIWRYVDLAKFVDLLDRRELFFARADCMRDPWEGEVRSATFAVQESLFAEMGFDPSQFPSLRRAVSGGGLRPRMHISCWHRSEDESAAMWDLYAGRGVAIQSTFERLEHALSGSRWFVVAGSVQYIDYSTTPVFGRMFHPFLCKRKSFEHEQEVRALVYAVTKDPDTRGGLVPPEPAFETGLSVAVDLDILVEHVYVSPTEPAWIARVIRRTAEKFGLDGRMVTHSDLYAPVIH
jgi:hypothetical protein